MPEPLDAALAQVRSLLLDRDRLLRAVAAGRRRTGLPTWRKVELRPVQLKGGLCLQVTAYDERQAHTTNEPYEGERAAAAVDLLLGEPYGNWHVETLDGTVQLRVTKRGEAQVHRSGPPDPLGTDDAAAVDRGHDRAKPRLLDPAEPFWRVLGITDAHGKVKPSRQDKYRQVEELLRALEPVVDAAAANAQAAGRPLRVVDLGCGNAYLTLATYAYLHGARGLDVRITGVDVKAQARDHGTAAAAELGWSDAVSFVEGTALQAELGAEWDAGEVDIVLALHACDTATDEALARAVGLRATVVLASPCCHHDVQRQLTAQGAEPPAPYAGLVRHGILRERFADVLTDTFRAAQLRQQGYRVEVMEFVGSQHTPRNTLIRAVRTGAAASAEQVAEYQALTAAWGVTPRLETLLAPQATGA